MLYLVKVDLSMEWSNIPGRAALQAVAEHGGNLERLQWDAAERIATETTVALVLRYGTPVSRGIAVDGVDLVVEAWPQEMVRTHRQARESYARLGEQHEVIEALVPGSREHRDELVAGVEREHVAALARAREQLEQALAAPVQPKLVEHWRSLGGHLPPA